LTLARALLPSSFEAAVLRAVVSWLSVIRRINPKSPRISDFFAYLAISAAVGAQFCGAQTVWPG
jgi:hypothetical protein